ncbi:MAG: TRAP transporter small permease [Elusimicrobia bacterium]|nr:TRAP transporter small permease [Elusimicrobiota bacterium]
MDILKGAERRLAAFEQGALAAMLVVMVTLAFLQVVLRGVFDAGLLWADIFLRHLVLWLGFLGACLAASDDKQFAMDATAQFLPGKVRPAVQLLLHLLTALVCVLLAKAAWTFFGQEREGAAVLFSLGARQVPTWWFETILPAGFGLLAFHYVLKSGMSALELFRKGEA